MSIIEDAIIMQMAKDFKGPILVVPEGLITKRKKKPQEIFEEEFLRKNNRKELNTVPRVIPRPTPG